MPPTPQVLQMQPSSFVSDRNMKDKALSLLKNKNKTVPILSFPSAQLLNISVRELITSAEMQAAGMKVIAENFNIGASLNMMDLSVEAEAFGAKVRFYDDDIPAVEKGIIDDIADTGSITVPPVGAGRTAVCIEGVRKAKEQITSLPVFCGVIGPYSLAGRLFDMTELMMECYDSPDEVHILLCRATEFIKKYLKALKDAGADGVIMAEPAAGLLSPSLAEEFSFPYVKEIFDYVNDGEFIICYHNCGSSVDDMFDSVSELGADIVHLGNAVNLKRALRELPNDVIVMGNVDPVLLKHGSENEVRADVKRVYELCSSHENFMISTGCDVPAAAGLENIKAYFDAVEKIYQ